MKASAIGPLALIAFMATIQYGSALPAADLVPRIPVANPSLPKPSIGHGPVSALPTPVQRRDGSIAKRDPGFVCPGGAGGSGGECVEPSPITIATAPPCPFGTSIPGCVLPTSVPTVSSK